MAISASIRLTPSPQYTPQHRERTMLVAVFSGSDRRSATSKGSFHFAQSPAPGDQVEVEGELLIVTDAWHTPSIFYRGAKFAILARSGQTKREAALALAPEDAASVV